MGAPNVCKSSLTFGKRYGPANSAEQHNAHARCKLQTKPESRPCQRDRRSCRDPWGVQETQSAVGTLSAGKLRSPKQRFPKPLPRCRPSSLQLPRSGNRQIAKLQAQALRTLPGPSQFQMGSPPASCSTLVPSHSPSSAYAPLAVFSRLSLRGTELRLAAPEPDAKHGDRWPPLPSRLRMA